MSFSVLQAPAIEILILHTRLQVFFRLGEDIVMQTEQVEEVKPDESVAMQETVKPAVRMLAPAAVSPAVASPAASPEKIKEIELNLKPVTEITNINDFKSITYSPSDKMTLKEVIVYEGYDKVTGPIASVYNSD